MRILVSWLLSAIVNYLFLLDFNNNLQNKTLNTDKNLLDQSKNGSNYNTTNALTTVKVLNSNASKN